MYQRDFASRSGPSSVMVNKGLFIVRTGEFLRLYDADLKTITEHQLTRKGEYDQWTLRDVPQQKDIAVGPLHTFSISE